MPSVGRRRLVGLAVLIVVPLVAAYGTFRPAPWHHEHVVHAMFDEAKGLAPVERDVRVHGVNVGKIGTVRRVGDNADVELLLDDSAGPVYADATATLRPHSAFEGDAFVDLDPGHRSAGPLGDRPIPLAHTRVYVSLDQALRGLDARRRGDLREVAAELTAATPPDVQAAASRQLTRLPRILDNAAAATAAIRGPGGRQLRTALRNAGGLADALASDPDAISAALRNGRRTLAAVNDQGALDGVLARMPAALANIDTAAVTVQDLTAQLHTASSTLKPVLDATPGLLRTATPIVKRATPVLDDAPDLTTDLSRLLTNLSSSAPDVQALLGPTRASVEELDQRALPAITAKTRLGQQAYEQFLAAGTGLTGAVGHYQTLKQNPNGAGHFGDISADVIDGLLGMADDPCALVQLPLPIKLPGCP